MSCNDKCRFFRAKIDGELRNMGIGAYLQGFKRCNICNIFLSKEGIKEGGECVCCGRKVSNIPKDKKTKLSVLKNRYLLDKIKKQDERMLRSLFGC